MLTELKDQITGQAAIVELNFGSDPDSSAVPSPIRVVGTGDLDSMSVELSRMWTKEGFPLERDFPFTLVYRSGRMASYILEERR